jgi:hypothetical protein
MYEGEGELYGRRCRVYPTRLEIGQRRAMTCGELDTVPMLAECLAECGCDQWEWAKVLGRQHTPGFILEKLKFLQSST